MVGTSYAKFVDNRLSVRRDLADLNNDGHLTREGLAVAIHLIQGKLKGRDIPATIPPSLIPPSMRGAGALSAPGTQPHSASVPEAIRDLLWDDSPPASATVPQPQLPALQPQSTGAFSTSTLHPQSTGARQAALMPPPPQSYWTASTPPTDPFASANSPFAAPAAPYVHHDLLGDDDEPTQAASPPLQDRSAEIGNVKNQLSSTNRSLETTQAERESMERVLSEQAVQLSALQTQLSSAKAAYETETKLSATLRERFNNQAADIQKAREELIRAESDLSAVRVEKAEVEGAVLRDKEEVRDLQRRMTEVGMEVETLKAEVEKAKKEAKQQKGLLAIAKKQLATREAERARVQKELEDAQKEAAEATTEREQAEAELEKDTPAPLTNGHGGIASPDIVAIAAAQPLPATPEVPTSPTGSVLSLGKSNNPFERVALASSAGSRAQSPLPFLPFTNTGNLPTPPTAPAEFRTEPVAQQSTPISTAANPFRFSQAFVSLENSSLSEPVETSGGPEIFSPAEVTSPTDTDMFHTPPTSATIPVPAPSISTALTEALGEHIAAPSEHTAETSIFDDPGATTAPAPAAEPKPAEDTDLSHQLKDLDVEESDSDSESEENEPLAHVKERLSNEVPHAEGNTQPPAPSTISAFDDSFGISVPTQDATSALARSQTPLATVSAPTNAFDEAFAPSTATQPSEPFAAPMSIPSTAELKTNGDHFGTPGVDDFDEAMSKLGASTSTSGGPSQFSDFSFDTTFDDNFDFAAASAATGQPAVSNGNGDLAPAVAPVSTGNAFDSVFLSQPESAFPPVGASPAPAPVASTASPFGQPAAQETRPFSFDEAFGAGSSSTQLQTNETSSNGSATNAILFDDAFGGQPLSLDNSFASATTQTSNAPSQAKGPTPFPMTTSPPQSPTSTSSPRVDPRRSISPGPTRHMSPPPRHSSPKPHGRPSTAGSEKEKAPTTRHSKLSVSIPPGIHAPSADELACVVDTSAVRTQEEDSTT